MEVRHITHKETSPVSWRMDDEKILPGLGAHELSGDVTGTTAYKAKFSSKVPTSARLSMISSSVSWSPASWPFKRRMIAAAKACEGL